MIKKASRVWRLLSFLLILFLLLLCLTGCSLSPRLYEGVWAAENLQFDDLTIDRLEMTIERCPEKPAWDEYDTFSYPDRDGEWSIYFRISFLIDGVRSEFVTADFHKPNNRLMCSLTWKGDDIVFFGDICGKEGEIYFDCALGSSHLGSDWQKNDLLDFQMPEVL